MITRCEHCGSKFEVNAELVYSNDPAVRCGECLSLFDARACLFNEAESGKIPATLKPVEKRQRVEQPATALDAIDLETADTIAVEHFYTSEASRHRAESGGVDSAVTQAAVADDFTAGRNAIPAAYISDRGTGQANGQTSSQTNSQTRSRAASQYSDHNGRDNLYPEYRPASNYPDDMEFERTAATEKSLPDRDYQTSHNYSDPVDHDRATDKIYTDYADGPTGGVSSEADSAAYKKQLMREREQRALRVEPDRDFESAPDIENFADRPDVMRDSGFRTDEDTQFQSDTPRFDTSLDERTQQSDAPVLPSTYDNIARGRIGEVRYENEYKDYSNKAERPDASVADLSPDESEQADYVAQNERGAYATSRKHSYAADDVTTDINASDSYADDYQRLHEEDEYDGPAIREEQYVVPESSARDMRRYQQNHQSLEIKKLDDDHDDADTEHVYTPEELLVEREARARTERQARRQSSAGAVFWLLGLVAAVCLFLFAARSVIANMNLPVPVITSFCQITGCVPAQPRKDVSQLQIMRQRLYPHPEIENAIVISADVVNNSVYKQPLPTLAISLRGANNQLVAERNFESNDYEIVDGSEPGYLMPDEPTRIKIEVVDTGLAALEFDLAFK